MAIDLSQWRARIAEWRKESRKRPTFASSKNIKALSASAYDQVIKHLGSIVSGFALLLAGAFFRDFFDPLSAWFWFAIVYIMIIVVLGRSKYYKLSVTALAAFLIFIGVISIRAPYYIASDQSRLRYRVIEGTSYLEFPQQISLLKTIANSFDGKTLITVMQCDDKKVAALPHLPYQPLFLDNNFTDNVGFRRLPALQFHSLSLTASALIGRPSPSNNARHGRFGFEFGFSSSDSAAIAVTSIFPRSLKCKPNGIPLLPILEVLPWLPDETASLIKTAIKVDKLRKNYPEQSLSLDDLRQMQVKHDDDAYSALFDFFVYSLIYETFNGNVFAQMRAHIGNALCTVVVSHPSIFAGQGPFSSLAENFLRRFVAEFGFNANLAAPACHVSEDLVRAYKKLESATDPFPFFATFRSCLEAEGSIGKCLGKKDPSEPGPTCKGVACSLPTPPPIPDEKLLEIYDEKFSSIVATKQNEFLDIASITPSECPELRDNEEAKHFVEWWMGHSNEITIQPAECSSAWRAQYNRSREELRDALSCATRRKIRGIRHEEEGPEVMDILLAAKCNENIDFNKLVLIKQMSALFGQLDSVISDLNRYSALIGDTESRSLIKALQMFATIKEAVCGARDIEPCVDEYGLWQDYQRLTNKIAESLGLSDFDGGEAELIGAFTKLDNVIIDMSICDALQDEEFSKRSGYDRTTYCDSHGLSEYRLRGSEPVWHSIERGNDENDPGVSYLFESNGVDKKFEIEKFLDK